MRKLAVISFMFILLVLACKKDPPAVTPTETYNPTAYSFQLPGFLPTLKPIEVPGDNPMTAEGIALGRKLFYDKALSNDFSMNCASCHKQENSFDDPRQFSTGTNGSLGNRNAMSIMYSAWNKHFFWDGRRASLEGQAHDPVTNAIEMENSWPVVVQRIQDNAVYPPLFFKAFGTRTVDSNLITKAIAQFERTLFSFNSRYDKYMQDNGTYTQDEHHGYELFFQMGCHRCHAGDLFTDGSFRNNGLDVTPPDSGLAKFTHDPADYGKFKVPSLRNVALTAPYMHDGRFTTLTQLIGFYSTGVNMNSPNLDSNMHNFGSGLGLTSAQRRELLAFLNSLTDSTVITNPAFSAP